MSSELMHPPNVEEAIADAMGEDETLRYENEWVWFVDSLSTNQSLDKIAYYAMKCRFTSRAKRKIIAYTYSLLGRNLSVTQINTPHDLTRFDNDKAVIDSLLKMGLTNFDITDEFLMIVSMIQLQYDTMISQSKGGAERKAIITTGKVIKAESLYVDDNRSASKMDSMLDSGNQKY